MMSNKWAFSLTILITILALVFAVSSAFAQVKVEFSAEDVSSADGIQLEYGASVQITVKLDKIIDAATLTQIKVVSVNKFGGVIGDTAPAAVTLVAQAATVVRKEGGQEFHLTLPAGATTLVPGTTPLEDATNPVKVLVIAPKDKIVSVDGVHKNAATTKEFLLVRAEPTGNAGADAVPKVVSITRITPIGATAGGAFVSQKVTGPFDVKIVLTEQPKEFKAGHIKVDEGTASAPVAGIPFAASTTPVLPDPAEGGYTSSDPAPAVSGRDSMYHPYLVTITPKQAGKTGDFDVTVRVETFDDMVLPTPNRYTRSSDTMLDGQPDGRERLRVKATPSPTALAAGVRLNLPHGEGATIPANGYYLLTRDKDGSGIDWSHEKDEENINHKQTPAQLLYNVRASGDLPNLNNFLSNSGTIDLVAYDGKAAGSAYISEVMWGTDASQDPATKSQWIEIANGTSAAIGIGENKWALWFYQANEAPPASYTGGTLLDRISTKDPTTGLGWSLAGKGQSGRTGLGEGQDVLAVSPIQKLISMYRVMDATTGAPANGTMANSWMATRPPSVNFKLGNEGRYDATPGAAPIVTAEQLAAAEKAKMDAAAAEKAKADAAAAKESATGTYPMAGDGRVYISEVMFAGGGTLPQWIEIANGDRAKEFNLSGWTLTVDNATADADVSVSSATFTIPDGTTIAPSAQNDTPSTILVVTERGRNNLTGAMASGQVINLAVDNETELIIAGILRGRYALLSDMAFLITLSPPVPEATKAPAGETSAAKATRQAAEKKAAATRKAAMDMAGNLGADGTAAWALPMNEGGARSSIIRKHIQVTRGPAAPEDGMMADNWTLASNTSFAQVTHIRAQSYYGAANDVGTPGFRAGGALPVELSHFSPARDKVTDAVVITWSTQSELNNAGFFIKRSQQRDGEFKVINATMVPGAGTTSEKQFYTYTDTTAQPNVVYYYQIEDVSLDGNRQTLTRGIRLKGHVGAAGKATTLWGELKTSHE